MTDKFSIAAVLHYYGGTDADPASSTWRRMRCPFHPDSTASAQYNSRTGKFNCFACDFSGDAIDLVIWRGDAPDFPRAKSFCEGIPGAGDGPVSGRPTRLSSRRLRAEAGRAEGQLDMFGPRLQRRRHRV